MSKGVDVHQEVDEPVHDVLVLVLVLVTPEMVTLETLKSMNLLVETGLHHVVDGLVDDGLVVEHVVVVLVEDHKVDACGKWPCG